MVLGHWVLLVKIKCRSSWILKKLTLFSIYKFGIEFHCLEVSVPTQKDFESYLPTWPSWHPLLQSLCSPGWCFPPAWWSHTWQCDQPPEYWVWTGAPSCWRLPHHPEGPENTKSENLHFLPIYQTCMKTESEHSPNINKSPLLFCEYLSTSPACSMVAGLCNLPIIANTSYYWLG